MKPIEKMTVKELERLEDKLAQQKIKRRAEEKARLLGKIDALTSGTSFTLKDLFSNGPRQPRTYRKRKSGPRKKHTSKIKIVHPDDPTKVYRGLGRKPAWVKELET